MPSAQTTDFCPYKGLQPYEEADQKYFFGRQRDTEIIISNLYAAPLTVLYGTSGVGKSSVLLAGVMPKLRGERHVVSIVFREWQDKDFLTALKMQILTSLNLDSGSRGEIDLSWPLDKFLRKCSRATGSKIFLILDQFEEYFLYHPKTEHRESDDDFDKQFALAVNRSEINANFLLAMRDDGLSKLDRLQPRIPHVMNNLLRLEHLGTESAREAICGPLDRYNAEFGSEGFVSIEGGQNPASNGEPDLVSRLLTDLRTGRVTLDQSGQGHITLQAEASENLIETPFLQMVLMRLWEERDPKSNRLQLSTYERLGSAQTIVRTHLDKVMEDKFANDANGRDIASLLFRYLVTPDGGKIALSQSVLAAWVRRPLGQVAAVVNLLSASDVRILRPVDASLGIHTPKRYEIFHDVLAPAILAWRAQYVHAQKEARAAHIAAQDAARKEKEAAQKLQLEQAEALAAARAAQLEAEKKARREIEAAKQLQIEQAEALAEAERQRAIEQEKLANEKAGSARRLRRLVGALAAAIVVTVVLALVAIAQGKQKNNAILQQSMALLRVTELENARKAAAEKAASDEQIRAGEERRKIAEARADEAEKRKAELSKANEEAHLHELQAVAARKQEAIAKEKAQAKEKEARDNADKYSDLLSKEKERRTADNLANYGSITFYQGGNLAQALGYQKRALDIFDEIKDEDSKANTLSRMAGMYSQQAKNVEAPEQQTVYDQAEKFFQDAIDIRERHAQDEELARLINYKAVVIGTRSRYLRAKPLYERALKIRQQVLSSHDRDLALSYRNLASNGLSLTDYDEAESFYRKALEIDTANQDAVNISRDLGQIGLIRYYQGRYKDAESPQERYKDAESLYKEALDKIADPTNAYVATLKHNLALLYLAQGKYDLVEPLELEAMKIDEKAKLENSDAKASRLMALARLFREQGEYAKAEFFYQQALNEATKVSGTETWRVALYKHYRAQFYAAQAKWKEAEEFEDDAIKTFATEGMLHPNNWFTSRSLATLALIYANTNRETEAEALYKKSLDELEQLLGHDHPELASVLTWLGELYLQQKRYDQAELLIRRALAIREKKLGPEHPEVAVSLDDLGRIYANQNKPAEAEAFFSRAFKIQQRTKPNHSDFAQTLGDYALLLRQTNRTADAATLESRARSIRERLSKPLNGCVEDGILSGTSTRR